MRLRITTSDGEEGDEATAHDHFLVLLAACSRGEGERCNPLRATSDCDPGLTCVYPTAPMCGVPYCCAVDSQGSVVDRDPHCQPDPDAIAACMLDLSTVPLDAGSD